MAFGKSGGCSDRVSKRADAVAGTGASSTPPGMRSPGRRAPLTPGHQVAHRPSQVPLQVPARAHQSPNVQQGPPTAARTEPQSELVTFGRSHTGRTGRAQTRARCGKSQAERRPRGPHHPQRLDACNKLIRLPASSTVASCSTRRNSRRRLNKTSDALSACIGCRKTNMA